MEVEETKRRLKDTEAREREYRMKYEAMVPKFVELQNMIVRVEHLEAEVR